MPYIHQERRKELDAGATAKNGGELNYTISSLFNTYLIEHGISYQTISDCTSAADNAVREFYRMVVGPYENRKILENGRVYTIVDKLE